MKKVAVVGGGASGLVAAYFAARSGCSVVLFEKQKKLGRKILITGNGRCNLSNRFIDVSKYHGRNPAFAQEVLSRFGAEKTLDFFLSIGIPVVELSEGRLFPASLQASTIPRILEYELSKTGIDIQLHRKIEVIKPERGRMRLVTAGREVQHFDSVILSTGSCAYAPAGASRIGYELAASQGHTVYEPFPSILPINIPLKILHRLDGIKWECRTAVEEEGKITASSSGELLFTSYGISGPAALDISRAVNEAVIRGRSPRILIDLFPDCDGASLREKVTRLLDDPDKKVSFSLSGIMKDRMPGVLLGIGGMDPEMRAGDASGADIEAIVSVLKNLRLSPGAPRPIAEAVVAAGGVDVDEIDPSTMESRIQKNLFITGELLDIDGDTGGYNLQFAWSTGAIAGISQ